MVTHDVSRSSVRLFLPCAALALMAVASAPPAQARHRHGSYPRFVHAYRGVHTPHTGRTSFASSVGATNFAAMVVDANSGRTLYAANEDAPRHPASLTKVMTLYLLFEELESGRMRLDTPLSVSAHAAAQSPTKLGLRPGSTITVENAIKAIVTKSANDMAVTVAENIAGDEPTFAEAMTQKARALGMAHTFYHNASGLPDMRQLTTARDLTILGRAIRERFPQYYHYFSTPSFTYAGTFMPNHNHLLGKIDGMDGIKTGYTTASGFNLLTSVNRGGRHIVSVVLGGRTAASRDRVMQALIESHFEEASATPGTRVADSSPVEAASETPARTVREQPIERQPPRGRSEATSQDIAASQDQEVGGSSDPRLVPTDVTFTQSDDRAGGPIERQPPRGPSLIAPDLALPPPVRTARAEAAKAEPPRPVAKPTLVKVALLKPVEAKAPRAEDRPRPAFIAGAPKAVDPARLPAPLAAAERRRIVQDGSTNRRPVFEGATSPAVATATPSSLRWVKGPAPVRLGPSAADIRAASLAKTQDETFSISPQRSSPKAETQVAGVESSRESAPTQSPVRGGWVIQIGATDAADKANDLLSRAKLEGHSALASAKPFTERIQKGDSTLYRARFAGLDPTEAEAACRTLKRSGFACFATRNN